MGKAQVGLLLSKPLDYVAVGHDNRWSNQEPGPYHLKVRLGCILVVPLKRNSEVANGTDTVGDPTQHLSLDHLA